MVRRGEALDNIRGETIRTLRSLLAPGETVALVDFPNHQNSGDSLIWSGELRYLSALEIRLGYQCDMSRYSPERLIERVPEGPILITGGGNFGDRWPHIQEFHERVVADFPNRRIIQLPQTIDFQRSENLRRAQAVFGNHRDLTLLIRDRAGTEVTKRLFPRQTVLFCPDMALGASDVPARTGRPKVDVVFVRRSDHESSLQDAEAGLTGPFSSTALDWGLRRWRLPAWKLLSVPGALSKRSSRASHALYAAVTKSNDLKVKINIANAAEILSTGQIVVTDRLHATVLCGLMGIPVVALNNANGKVAAIYRDYLGSLEGVHLANSVEEASERCASILRSDCPAYE